MRLLLSLLYLTTLLVHVHCKEVFGIVGENFTFPVPVDQKVFEPVWKKNKDLVAEWEGQSEPKYLGPLENRSVLMENGSLTIINLQKNDAGSYELHYGDSVKDHYLDFVLTVLDSLPEPEISCNTSDDQVVLNCTAHFQRSLNYAWKLSNSRRSYQTQELSIPLKDVDATTNATCIIKFLQTERSSEISLSQCLPEEKGSSSGKRERYGLIGAVVGIISIGPLVYLCLKGRKTAESNSPVNDSGEREQLFPGSSQQQPNSEEASFSHAAHCENEEPEADRALNEDSSALRGKQIVKNCVNQEETTQDAEGGKGEHLNNSSSCNKGDLKA